MSALYMGTTQAIAGVTVTIEEVGNDVVMTGAGTLDLTLWMYYLQGAGNTVIEASNGITLGSPADMDIYYQPIGLTGASNLGPLDSPQYPDATSGDFLGLWWEADFLFAPLGYESGAELTGSAHYEDESFQSIGLTEGVYTWMWDTTTGTDFFTVHVVPAPGVLALLGIAGMFGARRRRMR